MAVYKKLEIDRLVPLHYRQTPMNAKARLIQEVRQLLIAHGLGSFRPTLVTCWCASYLMRRISGAFANWWRLSDCAPSTWNARHANRTHLFYQEPDYKSKIADCIPTLPFTGYIDLRYHAKTIATWFPAACGVLEVAVGNGYTSLFIRNALNRRATSGTILSGYTATDLYEPLQNYFSPYERGISSDAAVRKYYGQFNVLIMVCAAVQRLGRLLCD